jgi:DNA helicase-2/ATP-dependent DNA helicase PcrA
VDPITKTYILKRGSDSLRPARSSVEFQQALNPQQWAVVSAPAGPALVIAGAGSGKTRTLIYRLGYLLNQGADPASVLLLTFTRKAAQEMLDRAGQLIGSQAERVVGGTFHSIGNLLLRRYGRAIGIEAGFTILDRGDSEDLINLVRNQLGFSDKERRFPRKGTIGEIFSKAANTLQPLEHIVMSEFDHFAEHRDDLARLQTAYAAAKRERQLLDYDDLLVKVRELLERDAAVRETISSQFQSILVDEYQDTNRLQADLIRNLAATHNNVMVVGDDSQSIYAFRGATFRNIMDFPTLFPGATVYRLEENYRSTQPVLNLANEIISSAVEKYSKRLFTRKLDGPLPALVQAGGENAQSRFLAQRILELREEGVPLGEMAVLFRSSYHSFDLEVELSRRDLPFIKRGGFKFIETAHVKDLLAYLRVVENPLDAVSWNRLLLLVDGVGPKKAQDLITSFMKADDPLTVLRQSGGRVAGSFRDLAAMLAEAKHVGAVNPAEQVNEVSRYYLPILKEHYDDYPKRMRDLEQLYAMAERYGTLREFLDDLALEPPDEGLGDSETADRDEERLILSTIHSAKGLEWQCVFIIWVVDGRFPSAYSMSTEEELEEERRLLYVAVTRAKKHLYLTYPVNVYDRTTGAILSKPSRFLEAVPSSLLDTWTLQDEGGGSGWG